MHLLFWSTKSVPIWNLQTSVQWHFNLLLRKCIHHLFEIEFKTYFSRTKFIESNIKTGFLRTISGTIEHKLLLKELKYHHIPDVIKLLITDYYKNYTITIGTDPLIIDKETLQRDCLSPLLFSMVINTLLKALDEERICCMGYNFWNSLAPRNSFQFADDSVLVTSTEQDSQQLLNLFTKLCKWGNLIVWVHYQYNLNHVLVN